MNCKYCGKKINDYAKICPVCGCQVTENGGYFFEIAENCDEWKHEDSSVVNNAVYSVAAPVQEAFNDMPKTEVIPPQSISNAAPPMAQGMMQSNSVPYKRKSGAHSKVGIKMSNKPYEQDMVDTRSFLEMKRRSRVEKKRKKLILGITAGVTVVVAVIIAAFVIASFTSQKDKKDEPVPTQQTNPATQFVLKEAEKDITVVYEDGSEQKIETKHIRTDENGVLYVHSRKLLFTVYNKGKEDNDKIKWEPDSKVEYIWFQNDKKEKVITFCLLKDSYREGEGEEKQFLEKSADGQGQPVQRKIANEHEEKYYIPLKAFLDSVQNTGFSFDEKKMKLSQIPSAD